MAEHDHIERRGGGTFTQLREASDVVRTRTVFHRLGFAAVIGWLYVILMSDLFTVTEIHVNGLKALDPVEVEREVFQVLDSRKGWRPWSARQVWFIDQTSLAEQLKERLFASRVIVDKSYTNVLRLSVEERAKRLVLHSHQQYFWVDLQGLVTAELSVEERKQIQSRLLGTRSISSDEPPVIHRDLDEPLAQGYLVADTTQIKNWIQSATEIVKRGVLYRELEPPVAPSSTTAILISEEGTHVLLDLYAPLEPQLRSYVAFKKNPAHSGVPVAEYVDVRIPGRLYVK